MFLKKLHIEKYMCTRGEKVKKVKKGVSVDNFCKTPCSLYPLYKLNGRVYIRLWTQKDTSKTFL